MNRTRAANQQRGIPDEQLQLSLSTRHFPSLAPGELAKCENQRKESLQSVLRPHYRLISPLGLSPPAECSSNHSAPEHRSFTSHHKEPSDERPLLRLVNILISHSLCGVALTSPSLWCVSLSVSPCGPTSCSLCALNRNTQTH